MERNNSKKRFKPRIKKDSKAEMELTDSIIMEILNQNDILCKDIEPMDICNNIVESLETEKFLSMEVCIDLLKDLEPLEPPELVESIESTVIIKNIVEPIDLQLREVVEPIEILDLLNCPTPEILNPIESEVIVEPIVAIQKLESKESETSIKSIESELIKYRCLHSVTPETVEPILPIQNLELSKTENPTKPIVVIQNLESTKISSNNMLYITGSVMLTLILVYSYFRKK